MLYIFSEILGSERLSYFLMAGFKSFGYLIIPRCLENAEKLLIAPEPDPKLWAVETT
jgi:hypothetical protein